jgi:hypothetical protein
LPDECYAALVPIFNGLDGQAIVVSLKIRTQNRQLLSAFNRRKPLLASIMLVATHRKPIPTSRQRSIPAKGSLQLAKPDQTDKMMVLQQFQEAAKAASSKFFAPAAVNWRTVSAAGAGRRHNWIRIGGNARS